MYKILPLENSRYEETLEFVCQEFIAGSVLHRATGVRLNDYIEYLRKPFGGMAEENMSFTAVENKTNDVIGCLLAGDFVASVQSDQTVPEELKPICALLNELEICYMSKRSITPGSILKVDIAVVSVAMRGRGVYAKLRESVHFAGAANGYEYVVGELTSEATQNLCVQKLKQKVLCEIDYVSFSHEGNYPFSSIKDPKSIQLVEGDILPLLEYQ